MYGLILQRIAMRSSFVLLLSLGVAVIAVMGAFIFLRPQETVSLPLKIEEYGDFNCVHCRDFEPVAKQIQDEFGDEIEFTFVNHPILGADSRQKAYAAEAARIQGKFNEFKQEMYDNFGTSGETVIIAAATKLNLDMNKFNADRESAAVQTLIDDQYQANSGRGITSTPSVYINGKLVVNRDYESLKKVINDKLTLGKEQAAKANENN